MPGAIAWGARHLAALEGRPGYDRVREMVEESHNVANLAAILALDELLSRVMRDNLPTYDWLWVRIFLSEGLPLRAGITVGKADLPLGEKTVPLWLPQFAALAARGGELPKGPTAWERLGVECDE